MSEHIFEPVPFLFGGDLSRWIEWKGTLATAIDVDPREIVLTGSAAVGFSLNPNKAFKPFDDASDIDCGIISSHHFDVAWRYLRHLRVGWLTLEPQAKRAIEMHRTNYVFTGTIATDRILNLLPFGRQWQTALERAATMAPTVGRDVKLRIYKDYEALRYYQASNIRRLRDVLSDVLADKTNVDAIPVEHVDESL